MKMQNPGRIKALFVCLFFAPFIVTFSVGCNKAEPFVESKPSPQPPPIWVGERPNIIIILADDVGYDAIACNGNGTFETPVIDQMARDGMRFTHVYSSPLCSPSRTAFVSGKYNFRNYFEWGIWDFRWKSFGNIAREAGYATYVAGKWAFDGGAKTADFIGFDAHSLWDPFKNEPPGEHYKNPKIYRDGEFLPASETDGKYGDDIHTSDILSFIKKNEGKPFFVFYPITLCHFPYSPTPDDSDYNRWTPKKDRPDVKYFPSMIKYMDKKIGEIRDSLKAWGRYDNTILMFSGDNGTPQDIFYLYNGQISEGSKSSTNASGTQVPLFVTWPKAIKPGTVNRSLIEFQDFLPTVADAVGKTIDSSYGTIDGISFFPQLVGEATEVRPYVFNHYVPYTNNGNDKKRRWINDTTYKLYDETGLFYNIFLDPLEKSPIRQNKQTKEEKEIIENFQKIMDGLK